jgi:hypothetical protein
MTMITEISPLEGIDLEGSPPCGMQMRHKGWAPCGTPAIYRIYSVCSSCGNKWSLFLCGYCHDEAIAGHTRCSRCNQARGITEYR